MRFLGGGVPSRLGDLGERRELPQRGPGRSPGRQRIPDIFQGLRILPVETMHYRTNQQFGGAWARFGGPVPPWPQPKTATVPSLPFPSPPIRTYWLKIAYFSYPSLIRRPRSLCSLWNFAVKLSMRKLESWGTVIHDSLEIMGSPVDSGPLIHRRQRRRGHRCQDPPNI